MMQHIRQPPITICSFQENNYTEYVEFSILTVTNYILIHQFKQDKFCIKKKLQLYHFVNANNVDRSRYNVSFRLALILVFSF